MNTFNYNQIYTKLKNHFCGNNSKITDFNGGSIISTIFEAIARVVERLYIETRIGYNNALKTIPYALFNFKKKNGQKASAVIKFTANSNAVRETVIPIGTIVSSGGLKFITTTIGIINVGSINSNDVICVAEEIGTDYNVLENTITVIESIVPENVVSVTNANKAVGGTNTETENQLLSRFKTYINGLQGTNPYGLEAAVLNIDTIRSVYIEEKFPPEAGNNFYVYVDNGTGSISQELKDEIKKVVNGDLTVDYPGYKATGMNFDVAAATPIYITITGVAVKYRTDKATADHDISEALKEEINNLTIGEDVLLTSIIMKLRQISYIKDVSGIQINGETENFTIRNTQIARFESATFEYDDE